MARRSLAHDPGAQRCGFLFCDQAHRSAGKVPSTGLGMGYDNVEINCTVENQRMAEYRLPILQKRTDCTQGDCLRTVALGDRFIAVSGRLGASSGGRGENLEVMREFATTIDLRPASAVRGRGCSVLFQTNRSAVTKGRESLSHPQAISARPGQKGGHQLFWGKERK